MNRRLWMVTAITAIGFVLSIAAMALFILVDSLDSIAYGTPMLTVGLIGAVIVANRPDNRVGYIHWLGGLILAIAAFADGYALYSIDGHRLPLEEWAAWTTKWMFTTGYIVILVGTLYLFPTGHLQSRRWRLVASIAMIAFGLWVFGVATDPSPMEMKLNNSTYKFVNPAGLQLTEDLSPFVAPFVPVAIFISLFGAMGSLLSRTIRARGIERQQLKWLAWAIVMTLVPFIIYESTHAQDTEYPLLRLLLIAIAYLMFVAGIPAAIAIAVLRHDLYEIDRLINRTVVYLALTACLAAVYLGLVLGLGSLVRSLSGESSSLVTAASTLAVAALFRPVRTRIQQFVNRRFYRGTYDAARTLESFSSRLRDEVDLTILTAELQSVVTETLQPAHVSLWLRPSDRQTT